MAMFHRYENVIMYGGRFLNHPLTLTDKLFIMWKNIKHWFKKWKFFVNTDHYTIDPLPYPYIRFELTPKQMEQAKQIYKEKGTIEYTFYPCAGIGWGCKVKVWETNEYIDITDTSSW